MVYIITSYSFNPKLNYDKNHAWYYYNILYMNYVNSPVFKDIANWILHIVRKVKIPNWRCTLNICRNIHSLLIDLSLLFSLCLSSSLLPKHTDDGSTISVTTYNRYFGMSTLFSLSSSIWSPCASNCTLLEPMLLWFDSDYSLRNGFIYFACLA